MGAAGHLTAGYVTCLHSSRFVTDGDSTRVARHARSALTCIRLWPQAFDFGGFTVIVTLVWGCLSLLPVP